MNNVISATDVRKDWSLFIDQVVHGKPGVVKRNRDYFLSISLEQVMRLLEGYRFKAQIFPEEDSSFTLSLEDIDLVVNAPDLDTAKNEMAAELISYSQDYFNEFQLYYNAPNRKMHFPYVLKVLLLDDIKAVYGLINA
ncbi:MAG: hypothetical protein PHC92_04020 [Syntrophomonadaceae bacterium]|nr:hypothetical protein [Syntrophomonadaceae bacterium]